MSDTNTETSTATDTGASIDWAAITGASGAPRATAAPAANLPELPRVIGRLPIKCDTKTAIVQLPEPVKGVHCAAVWANSTVLSDCDKPAKDVCRPAVKFARPINDREIEVEFWGDGDGKVVGLGFKKAAFGGQLETRPVAIGVPIVEIEIIAGRTITCGCDGENWATDEWGQ